MINQWFNDEDCSGGRRFTPSPTFITGCTTIDCGTSGETDETAVYIIIGCSIAFVCCIVIVCAIYCKRRESKEQYFTNDDDNL